jgi:hypothetical protein
MFSAAAHAEETKLIGQPRWMGSGSILGIRVCDEAFLMTDTRCDHVTKGKFVVDGVEDKKFRGAGQTVRKFPSGSMFHVTFEDGRTGFIDEMDIGETKTQDPAIAAAECKKRGDPKVGMTSAQVAGTCWGKPEKVNRTATGSTIHDQYVYSGSRYVYLRNGIVDGIQTSGFSIG